MESSHHDELALWRQRLAATRSTSAKAMILCVWQAHAAKLSFGAQTMVEPSRAETRVQNRYLHHTRVGRSRSRAVTRSATCQWRDSIVSFPLEVRRKVASTKVPALGFLLEQDSFQTRVARLSRCFPPEPPSLAPLVALRRTVLGPTVALTSCCLARRRLVRKFVAEYSGKHRPLMLRTAGLLLLLLWGLCRLFHICC